MVSCAQLNKAEVCEYIWLTQCQQTLGLVKLILERGREFPGGGGYEKILIVVFLKSHSVTQSVSLSVSLSVELINDISF